MFDTKACCLALGADKAGVADLAPFKAERWRVIPEDLLAPYTRAVSIALRVDPATLDGITDRPTVEYADEYRELNARLDSIAEALRDRLVHDGHLALAVPASAIIDEDGLSGALSHKAIAKMAGLGWQCRSLLRPAHTPGHGADGRAAPRGRAD